MKKLFFLCGLLTFLASCQTDSYDKGEGELSLTRADFVVAHANNEKKIDQVVTDDGQTLTLQTPTSAKWITTADSLYRAVLYYNQRETTDKTVEPVALSQITTLSPLPLEKFKEGIKTDPVTFESIWKSRNGKYINIGMYLKIGQIDNNEVHHTVGIAMEKVQTNADQTSTAYLTFYHDQGDVPEYYSSKYYISIPCNEIKADSVCITINSYKGIVKKKFSVK